MFQLSIWMSEKNCSHSIKEGRRDEKNWLNATELFDWHWEVLTTQRRNAFRPDSTVEEEPATSLGVFEM